MPPVVPARPPCWTTLVCRLMRFTPSTITLRCSDRTAITLPSAPLSLPAITRTVSPFLMFRFGFLCMAMSEHLRSQRDDLHEPLLAQLATHRAEDASAARLAVVLEDHCGVLVEADVGTVGTTALLDGPDHDGLDDVTLLDAATGDRVLHGGDDDVADSGVAPARATENTDAEDLLRTGVVGDLEPRLLLDHRFVLLVVAPVLTRLSTSVAGEPGGTDVGWSCPTAWCCLVLPAWSTWPSRGPRRPASAWWPTAGGSPGSARGRRRRTG